METPPHRSNIDKNNISMILPNIFLDYSAEMNILQKLAMSLAKYTEDCQLTLSVCRFRSNLKCPFEQSERCQLCCLCCLFLISTGSSVPCRGNKAVSPVMGAVLREGDEPGPWSQCVSNFILGCFFVTDKLFSFKNVQCFNIIEAQKYLLEKVWRSGWNEILLRKALPLQHLLDPMGVAERRGEAPPTAGHFLPTLVLSWFWQISRFWWSKILSPDDVMGTSSNTILWNKFTGINI